MAPTGTTSGENRSSENGHAAIERSESNINIAVEKFKDKTQFGEFDLNL